MIMKPQAVEESKSMSQETEAENIAALRQIPQSNGEERTQIIEMRKIIALERIATILESMGANAGNLFDLTQETKDNT